MPVSCSISFADFLQIARSSRGNNRQCVDVIAAQTLPKLINAQAQPAPQCLPTLALAAHIPQSAYLEDIGIIPAFFQRRVGEDKFQLGIKAEQLLLSFIMRL